MSHSSPVQSTGFARSSTLRQQIQTLPLSCSGPVAVLAATAPLKISINPLSQPTQVSVVVTILFLSQVPASVVQTNLAISYWRLVEGILRGTNGFSWFPLCFSRHGCQGGAHLTVRQGSHGCCSW